MSTQKQHAEKEITDPVLLCDDKGNLNPAAIGFARKPLIDSNLKGHYLRKKKWNYWCVYGEEMLFSATISHLDYAAVCFVYIFDYETQRFFEKNVTIPLGPNLTMPTNVLETVQFFGKDMTIRFVYADGTTHMTVTVPDFDGEQLHAELQIEHPVHDESLNVVIPWSRTLFQHTAKHHILPSEGFVKVGERLYNFDKQESFAVLDFGRGVWPREATWNWAMGSQRVGEDRIGLNLGGRWTDGTGMTENAIYVNGKMTKISEDVIFTYDTKDFMKPWTIHTKFTDDVQLTFTPFYERLAATDLKVIMSDVHQMIGYFDGIVKLGDGEIIKFSQFLGAAEEHIAKW